MEVIKAGLLELSKSIISMSGVCNMKFADVTCTPGQNILADTQERIKICGEVSITSVMECVENKSKTTQLRRNVENMSNNALKQLRNDSETNYIHERVHSFNEARMQRESKGSDKGE